MENNEILTNEEVMETTEEIVNASSGKGFKVAAGIGLAVLAGAYKYIGKPLLAKLKAKKEEKQEIADVEFNESDVKDEDSEDISE